MKYLYAFVVRGGFLLSLLFFSLLAQAQTQPQENNPNLLKKSVDKLTIQNTTASNLPNKEAMTNVQSLNHLKSEPLNKTNPKNTDIVKDNNASPFDNLKGKEEEISKRDLFSKTYRNDDGSYTALIGAGPIHYAKNGRFLDIDHKVTSNPNSAFPYANTANLFESYFGSTAHKGVKSKTTEGEVLEFLNTKMYWEVNGQATGTINSQNAIAHVQDNKVYYHQLFGQISAEYIVLTGKRELNYIIPTKQALGSTPTNATYLVFSEDIQLPLGWKAITSEEGIHVKDQLGQTIFLYENPISNDASDSSTDFNEQNTVFESFQIGQILTVKTKVKTAWLLSSERIFPIKVDPTVTPDNTYRWTGWAARTNNGTGTGNNNEMFAGYTLEGYAMAGYSKFNLTTIPENSLIESAEVGFYYFENKGDLYNLFFPRQISLVNIPLDPVSSTFSEIANSPTTYIADNSVQWYFFGNETQSKEHWKKFTITSNSGYIQDAISEGYVAMAAYPYKSNNWNIDNYAKFRGYSDINKPYLTINYTTSCTTPSSNSASRYIKNVNFVGTLAPDTTYPNTGYSSGGYGDYRTTYAAKAKQIPGGGINVNVTTEENRAFIKSWVDWNKDGKYDSTEKVYDTGSILTPKTIFGFVVPMGTLPGIYNIRIRTSVNVQYFRPCGHISDGETEDYTFEVIADCPAKITAVNANLGDGVRCGTGSVKLTAKGTTDTTNYHWYTSEFGGSPIYSHPSGIYNTPDINSTTTLYVTASNGPCESVKRTPVVARIDPIPTIDFTQTESDICSDVASMTISSTGDKEEITLIHEKFNSGLGVFKNVEQGYIDINADWTNRNSPYVVSNPPYNVLSPAISSGYDGGKYAVAITDVQQTSNILRYLELSNSVNASQLTNLKFDFNLYYQPVAIDNLNYSYFRIQASSDGGINWTTLQTITSIQGNPGNWSKQSFTLPNNFNTQNLKVRFLIFSYGADDGWVGDIAAVDNIRLYGDKPLDTTFAWNAPGMDVFNADCTTPYSGTSTEVCIKPNDSQIENNAVWNITATATLSNGCDAVGNLQITNNNKVWNPTSATDWTSNEWKPSTSAPTADHCVIVKKELVLPTGQSGLAKNLLVKSGAKLTIQNDASLTVTDFVHNEAAVEDFLIKSGGSLVQVNDGAVNSGEITAERDFIFSSERKQYNFVISPLVDWPIKSMYTTPFVIKYVEGQNWFVNAGVGPYVPAKGYAIKEAAAGNSTISGIFKGVPANGLMSYPLQYGTATTQTGEQESGYNLVGNPYPSAMDVKKLYTDNSAKVEATFLFWDNRENPNTQQQGSDYNGSNYATFNAAAGTNGSGTAAPRFQGSSEAKIPNQFAEVGTAFLTRAHSNANGQPLNFNNAQRSASTTAVEFFGKNNDGSKNTSRYWLTLATPGSMEYMAAVVYHWEGDNAFSVDDSEAQGTSDEIYTLADNEQVIIHGREPFVDTDKVPLGVRLFDMGKYVISIYDKEGVFANGQNIYLRDKVEKVIYNLSQADYKFISEPGEFNTRFELIYKPYSLTDDASNSYSNKISIELKDKNIVATSTEHKITKIVLYDLNNRPMYQNSEVNALKISIPTKLYANQIVVVSLETETGEVMNKKLILK